MRRSSGENFIRPAVPVVAPVEPPPFAACSACRTSSAERVRIVTDGVDNVLCSDAAACCRRYRKGRTPQQYARTADHAFRSLNGALRCAAIVGPFGSGEACGLLPAAHVDQS